MENTTKEDTTMDDIINVSDFLDERLKDIKIIEAAINNTRKKTMLFQRLKYYQRRRSRSYLKKKKKNTRRKERFILKTHIWYSKRFKMLKIYNCSLPFVRNLKSSKYIYKSLSRGFVFDQSYKQTKLFKRSGTHFLENQCKENYLVKKYINNEEIEVGIMGIYLVVSYIKEVVDENIFEGLEYVTNVDCSFLLLNVPEKLNLEEFNFEFKELAEPEKKLNLEEFKELAEKKLELINQKDLNFYLKNDHKGGVIFVTNQKAMTTWLWLIKQSFIPVSICELERIALEETTFNYPFDCVQSKYYQEYEKVVNKEIIEKYERTPKGKRVDIDTEDLFVFNNNPNLLYFYFELPKGRIKKNAFIKQNGEEVGRVIRGGFAFTRGKCRGLGYLTKCIDLENNMTLTNLGEKKDYDILFIKYL